MHQDDVNAEPSSISVTTRRSFAMSTAGLAGLGSVLYPSVGNAEEADRKLLQEYPDFSASAEGWAYKDVKPGMKEDGKGDLKDGDRVVFDWSGYTIGYFGRPFEAKGGPQGGAFDKDVDFYRTILGSKTLIPGLEGSLR